MGYSSDMSIVIVAAMAAVGHPIRLDVSFRIRHPPVLDIAILYNAKNSAHETSSFHPTDKTESRSSYLIGHGFASSNCIPTS